MRVLVACEESQTVCKAFRRLGVEAYSSDIQECSGGYPQWHIKGDCIPVIENGCWDLIIAHPPCTYLSIAGACNMYLKDGTLNRERYEKMLQAREFFLYFYNLSGVRVCIENPRVMAMCQLPKYSQTIQPYQFGDNYTKKTLLWLKDLPYLIPLNYGYNDRRIEGIPSYVGTHYGSKSRSKFFDGIANAMAVQWSNLD